MKIRGSVIVEPVATYVPVGATMDVIAAAPPPVETTESLSAPDARLKALAEPLIAAGIKVEAVTLIGLAVDEFSNRRKNIRQTISFSVPTGMAPYIIFSAGASLRGS